MCAWINVINYFSNFLWWNNFFFWNIFNLLSSWKKDFGTKQRWTCKMSQMEVLGILMKRSMIVWKTGKMLWKINLWVLKSLFTYFLTWQNVENCGFVTWLALREERDWAYILINRINCSYLSAQLMDGTSEFNATDQPDTAGVFMKIPASPFPEAVQRILNRNVTPTFLSGQCLDVHRKTNFWRISKNFSRLKL